MFITLNRLTAAAIFSSLIAFSGVHAETIVQYTFEENPAGTTQSGAAANGVQFQDSSGNGSNIKNRTDFSVVNWTNDLPSVQPTGATSLSANNMNYNGTDPIDVSFAAYPELTIELWYKPNSEGTLRMIVDSGSGSNSWALLQETTGTSGAAADEFNLEFGYLDNNGVYRGINTQTTFSTNLANNDWTHIAVTVSTITGDIAIYFNGVEDKATAGVDENIDVLTFGNTSEMLSLGATSRPTNAGASFANNAFYDDLRISNKVLLPGNGTGDGELAWNATLIPEPGSMAVFGLGGLMLIQRR